MYRLFVPDSFEHRQLKDYMRKSCLSDEIVDSRCCKRMISKYDLKNFYRVPSRDMPPAVLKNDLLKEDAALKEILYEFASLLIGSRNRDVVLDVVRYEEQFEDDVDLQGQELLEADQEYERIIEERAHAGQAAHVEVAVDDGVAVEHQNAMEPLICALLPVKHHFERIYRLDHQPPSSNAELDALKKVPLLNIGQFIESRSSNDIEMWNFCSRRFQMPFRNWFLEKNER